MNDILIIISIFFVSLIGYSLIRVFNFLPKTEKLLTFSYSFGIGAGVIYLQMFLYSILSIPWKKEFILSPWIIFLICFALINRTGFKKFEIKLPHFSKVQLFLILLISLAVSYTLIEALIVPLATWDSWAIWLMKSKIFFIDGKVNSEILVYLRSDYPLLISLLGTFFYTILGKVNDSAILLVSFAFYSFLSLQFFCVLKKNFGTTYALFFTFLFVSTQNFIRHGGRLESGQADLPLAYFAFSSVTLMLYYLKKDSFRLLIFLSIYLVFLSFIKNEAIPLAFFILVPVLAHIYKTKKYKHLFSIVFWLFAILSWHLYVSKTGAKQNYLGDLALVSVAAAIGIFKEISKELDNIKTWNILWITYLFTIFAFLKNRTFEYLILNFIILSQFAFYMLPYFTHAQGYSPQSSLERLLIHLAPIAFLIIAYLFSPIWEIHFGVGKKSKGE